MARQHVLVRGVYLLSDMDRRIERVNELVRA